jgi:isoquinoline 1-oxidoreductase subunit alpha
VEITLNGRKVAVKSDANTPLLWVLREEFNLTGTKFGCGVMACGACTVQVDGQAQRACLLPVSQVQGKQIHTIERTDSPMLKALQQAWIKHQVPQCGYCQSGFLMAASALLDAHPKPSPEQVNAALTNICRCGTYDAMRAAIADVAGVPA